MIKAEKTCRRQVFLLLFLIAAYEGKVYESGISGGETISDTV